MLLSYITFSKRTTGIPYNFFKKGGIAMSDNTCKVVLALIGLVSTIVVVYKDVRLAEITSEKK